MFNIGDRVRIRSEWCNKPSEADIDYIVVNVNDCTKRCIIEAQNTGLPLAPTEVVGFDMIERR